MRHYLLQSPAGGSLTRNGRLRFLVILAETAALVLLLSGPRAACAEGAAGVVTAARRLQDLAARIETRYRSLPPFKVAFTERYTSTTFGSRDEARGTLHVVPPSRMLWIYDRPEGQRGALDGTVYWLIDPVDRQVTVRERPAGLADPLADLLAGRIELGKAFMVQEARGRAPAGRVLLELVPREPREDMDRAVLEADEADGTLRRLGIVDPLGNRFEYELGSPVPAAAPPADAFKLVVPQGYAETRE